MPLDDIGTADQVDAILRDPGCPPEVRATVVSLYEVHRYIEGVEFYTDNDGLSHVRPKSEEDTAPPVATPVPAPPSPPLATDPAPAATPAAGTGSETGVPVPADTATETMATPDVPAGSSEAVTDPAPADGNADDDTDDNAGAA